jgi:chemotaxis protein MotB
MVKNAPPALRQEETQGDPNHPNDHGQFLPRGGAGTETQPQSQTGPDTNAMQAEVTERVQNLDAAFQQLSKSLAALIRKGQVNVSMQSLGVVIDINEVLLFHSGKADLTPDALPLIDEVAKILAGLHYQIQVNGFTDNVPIHNAQFDSNWDLSATRAISVVKRFVAAGIDPTLLVGAGFGEYHPIATNGTTEGKAANRRVSIVVVSPLEGNDPARSRLVGSAPAAPSPSTATPPATAPGSSATAPAGAAVTPASPAPATPPVPLTIPASPTPATPPGVSPAPAVTAPAQGAAAPSAVAPAAPAR